MSAPFKALLIEGTSGIGKSTLIDGLLRRHVSDARERKIRTLYHMAQTHTYGPLARQEDAGTLTVEQNLRHLDRIVSQLEWLHAGAQEHDRPFCFVLLDTLHLTHCVRPGVVGWPDVAAIDRRLAGIGCKLLFLGATPDAIWERGIVPRMDQQFIQVYAQKFGKTLEEIHHYFVREQERLGDLARRSVMPGLSLHNEGPPGSLVEQVYRFWIS
jgi:hypothetical protein